ncbi:signal peptidase I [Pseudonocardia alni]|uniref:signal peptidase I n=1 Tax=Pseudonocardia alni TaxID=33907 RepID=UPI00331BA95B
MAVGLPRLIGAAAARVRAAARLLLGPAAALAVVVALVVCGALPWHLVRVDGDSMLPTLAPGDRLLVGPGTPGRGDLVVAVLPGSDDRVVKRVVAVGGDEVAVADGVLTVGGSPVAEPYADPHGTDGEYAGPTHVPDGAVYLLGDRRGRSVDSRHVGPVPLGAVPGRVLLRLWPAPGALP